MGVKTVEECFGMPTICKLKETNMLDLEFSIFGHLNNLNLYFAANMQMTYEQIKLLVKYFIEKHLNLTIGDIKLICDRVAKAKVFGQLSPNIVIQEADKYWTERLEIAEGISLEQHFERKRLAANSENENVAIQAWYDHIKETGIPKTQKDIQKENENGFRKFETNYVKEKTAKRGIKYCGNLGLMCTSMASNGECTAEVCSHQK